MKLRTNVNKVCITMDAHSRDIVINMCRDEVIVASHFQWQSQLKHKYRYWGRELELELERGKRG